MTNPKILILDIETSPTTAYVWGLFNVNISLNQIVEPSRLLCFAASYMDEKKVHFASEWADGHEGMVQRAWELLNEADIVVGYNSDSFDLRRLNSEFAKLHLGPPSPYQRLDIYKVVRKNFKFVSHKLDNILKELSLEGKVKHRGFSLWPDCMNGDVKAQAEMKKYCIGDVTPLKEAFTILQPWLPATFNLNTFHDGPEGCPRCGSQALIKEGFSYTSLGRYQRFSCRECKGWSRGAKRLAGGGVRGT